MAGTFQGFGLPDELAANLAETTHTVETAKARVAADALLESDKRKTVYALAIATQSLIHSMCWLAWDASTRHEVRKTAADLYNAEAHKLLPELFSGRDVR